MKKILLYVALSIGTFAVAQTKKDVGEFDKVKAFDRITVELFPSDDERIEITGTRSAEVEIVNKNGELKIRMKAGKLLEGEEIDTKLYYKKIVSIDANEGSVIGCNSTIAQDELYVSAQEGAQVNVKVDVKSLTAKAATGGRIKLSGTADRQDSALGAGGILDAKALKTQDTKVDVKAGGEAEVNATESADARVTAGGKIIIHGNPKDIKRKTTLGGRIDEVRD